MQMRQKSECPKLYPVCLYSLGAKVGHTESTLYSMGNVTKQTADSCHREPHRKWKSQSEAWQEWH